MFNSLKRINSIEQTLENDIKINIFKQRASCRVQTANARARKHNLIANLTQKSWRSILLDDFDSKCALTNNYGTEDNPLVMGHLIPINWGHGGSYIANVFPIETSLNSSLRDFNPLTFIPRAANRLNINMDSFNYLIEYLAKLNGLSVQEYYQYVQCCHDYSPNDSDNRFDILAFLYNIPEKKKHSWYYDLEIKKMSANTEIDSLYLWKSGVFSEREHRK